jgi:DNA-binding NarL/FixJ family response regulator
MEESIAIGIVHASRFIREGIGELLKRHPGVRVVGAFGDAREVLQQPPAEECLLLYDLGTARQTGEDLLKELRQRLPQVKILMFDVADNDQLIIECIDLGASGCILQGASLEELLEAARSVWKGKPVLSPRCVTSLFAYVAKLHAGDNPAPTDHLTKREDEVLRLIAQGLSNKEIAQRLYLQPQTVKNYVHLILQKLDMRSRLEVIRQLRAGRFQPAPSGPHVET